MWRNNQDYWEAVRARRRPVIFEECRHLTRFTALDVWQIVGHRYFDRERGWSLPCIRDDLAFFVQEGLARVVYVGKPGQPRVFEWVNHA